jgi:hypothetical protein
MLTLVFDVNLCWLMYPQALADAEASAALLLAHDPAERRRRREKARRRRESGARRARPNIFNSFGEQFLLFPTSSLELLPHRHHSTQDAPLSLVSHLLPTRRYCQANSTFRRPYGPTVKERYYLTKMLNPTLNHRELMALLRVKVCPPSFYLLQHALYLSVPPGGQHSAPNFRR